MITWSKSDVYHSQSYTEICRYQIYVSIRSLCGYINRPDGGCRTLCKHFLAALPASSPLARSCQVWAWVIQPLHLQPHFSSLYYKNPLGALLRSCSLTDLAPRWNRNAKCIACLRMFSTTLPLSWTAYLPCFPSPSEWLSLVSAAYCERSAAWLPALQRLA